MNNLIVLVALIVCILVSTTPAKTEFEFPTKECVAGLVTGNYVGCAAALAISIYKIHQWGEDTPVKICNMSCTGNMKGRVSSWKWNWDAKFQCAEKAAEIIGGFTAENPESAMQGAIKDWITKASEAKKINIKDFEC